VSPLFRAPASTANLGPGFDCAAAALDLWNELAVGTRNGGGEPPVQIDGEGASELPRDATNMTLRAFALLAPVEDHTFHFTNRIPLERGLGSSAAAVALGLAAGEAMSGKKVGHEELQRLGLELEGHADNLAAALVGGVCLTWSDDGEQHVAQVATELPLAPIAVVPEHRVPTAGSRARLPAQIAHDDAAQSAGRAALLGAALASGDADLLAASFHDSLHEPYRSGDAPLLSELRANLPAGAAGVTLSGAGPSVVVWARRDERDACVAELKSRLPQAHVWPLEVTPNGAEEAR
jgi:homoserine kinase